MSSDSTVFHVFSQCAHAIRDGRLIRRESERDKEFHFQNWVGGGLMADRMSLW